jgi:hypothetical protein
MSTQPLYIGFYHRTKGTKILTNVSNYVQSMEDHYLTLSSKVEREDVSNYLFEQTMEGRDANKFGTVILYTCYLLLKITSAFREEANFYFITLGENGDEISTDIDSGFVGNNNSAIRLFDTLCSELTPA